MKSDGFRGAWLAVVLIVALPLLAHVVRHREPLPIYSGEGFAAFYCGGEAVRTRRDPYRTEPLRTCEARTHDIPAHVSEPAPLPPATLAFFALLSALSFREATLVWLALSALAVGVTGLALVRLAPRVAPVAIWTALAPGLVVLNGYYGETPPVVVGALALGGFALARGATRWAVACATIAAAFEPHVGGAAWLSLVLFIPRARAPATLAACAFAALSIFVVGFGTTVEYLTRVLPAHAVSELPASDQYSLSSMLFALGVPARAATLAGSVSYVVALLCGLAAAPRAARTYRAPEFLAFVPAGAVLIGGAFLHDIQIPIALPLAIATANLGGRAARPLAYLCLLVGSVPQPGSALTFLSFGAAAAFAAAWSLPAVSGETRWYATRMAFGGAGAVVYAAFAALVHVLGAAATVAPGGHDAGLSAAPNALAEVGWQAYVTAISGPATPGEWLTKGVVEALSIAVFAILATTWRAGLAGDSKPTGNSVA
jgi:hypothetical protein